MNPRKVYCFKSHKDAQSPGRESLSECFHIGVGGSVCTGAAIPRAQWDQQVVKVGESDGHRVWVAQETITHHGDTEAGSHVGEEKSSWVLLAASR